MTAGTFKEVILHVTHEQFDELSGWQECAAVRLVDLGDNTCRLELSNDLERITAPGAGDA